MARCGDGASLRAEPMKVAPNSPLLGEAAPPRGEAQAAEVVSNELKAPKTNGFTEGEATACQALTVDSDVDRR
jgi:hypothetical protein